MTAEQLDLLALVAEAVRDADGLPPLPALFGDAGPAEWQRAADRWLAVASDTRWDRPTHWWHIGITQPGNSFGAAAGADALAEVAGGPCLPTLVQLDLRCDHHRGGCQCLGSFYSRGACLGCGWLGPVRDDYERLGVEDALDHAWAGWRDLPAVRPIPGGGDGPRDDQRRLDAWVAEVLPLHPAGWLQAGGPVRTLRADRRGTRHVPGRTPWGGYDCGTTEAAEAQAALSAAVRLQPVGGVL